MCPENDPSKSPEMSGLQCLEMTSGEAQDGLRLSRLANWNQTRTDWEFMLRFGMGAGFRTEEGVWVSSMIALPMGPTFGWISMVLTDPDWRRRGLARHLMGVGINRLQERGLVPALDATPDGEKVYRALGFEARVAMGRWKVEDVGDRPGSTGIRPMQEGDAGRVGEWDAARSGCRREAILRYLRTARPDLAFLAEGSDGGISGYVMGRSGDRCTQLGPLVADNPEVAGQLLGSALAAAGQPVYVDAFTAQQPVLAEAVGGTWSLERPFNRMVLGDVPGPGREACLFLAAGPELG